MIAFSYSPSIRESLKTMDVLRTELLTTSLNPHVLTQLQWDTDLLRIHGLLSLSNTHTRKQEIIDILTVPRAIKPTPHIRHVRALKRTFLYLADEWLVTDIPLRIDNLIDLYKGAASPLYGATPSRNTISNELSTVLEYIAHGNDHPYLTAGILLATVLQTNVFRGANMEMAILTSYLWSYKHGWDLFRLLPIEETIVARKMAFAEILKDSQNSENLTKFLEWWLESLSQEIGNLRERVGRNRHETYLPLHLWDINERQKDILAKLEESGAKITNTQVQRMFGTSQITSSRDLTKLVTLGLLYPHGKGRSIYYTKI